MLYEMQHRDCKKSMTYGKYMYPAVHDDRNLCSFMQLHNLDTFHKYFIASSDANH